MTKFRLSVDVDEIITFATFCNDWLRGLGVARGRISRFSVDLRRRPYNTLALPCECVMLNNLNMPTRYEVSMLDNSIDIEGVPKSPYLLSKFALRMRGIT